MWVAYVMIPVIPIWCQSRSNLLHLLGSNQLRVMTDNSWHELKWSLNMTKANLSFLPWDIVHVHMVLSFKLLTWRDHWPPPKKYGPSRRCVPIYVPVPGLFMVQCLCSTNSVKKSSRRLHINIVPSATMRTVPFATLIFSWKIFGKRTRLFKFAWSWMLIDYQTHFAILPFRVISVSRIKPWISISVPPTTRTTEDYNLMTCNLVFQIESYEEG